MKKAKLLFCSMLALVCFAPSCSKEENEGEDSSKKALSIVATVDGTVVESWKASDEIKVVVADEMYSFTTTAAGKTATFTEPEGTLTAKMIADNPVIAYYGCSNMYGTFRISAEPKVENGEIVWNAPMYAYTLNSPENNTLALSFKSAASVLAFNIEPFDLQIDKIAIEPAEGATLSYGALAGGFTVDAAQGNVKVTNAVNSISVEFATPLDLKQGAKINIPVGWFTLDGGLRVVLTYDGTKEYESVVWAEDGVVSSFNDNGGLRSGAVKDVNFEFDANSFPRAYYIKPSGSETSKGLSWSEPTTLKAALENAVAGSTLHLAAGTYKVDGEISSTDDLGVTSTVKTFAVTKNISIIGGYPANASTGATADPSANATILDGEGTAPHVLVVAAPKIDGEQVLLSGLTITGGCNSADAASVAINECTAAGNYAAGLLMLGTSVKVQNCTITKNSGVHAVGVYSSRSDVEFEGGVISENTGTGNGAGAWFASETDLEMDGTVIKDNSTTAIVGGLYLYAGAESEMKAEIKNTTISGNTATGNIGGVYVRDDTGKSGVDTSFENCTISGNTGVMGAAMTLLNANSSFEGCVIKNNTANGNGMVYVQTNAAAGSAVVFDGCSFLDNNITTTGGVAAGLYVYNNSSDGSIVVDVLNSSFNGNFAGGRGGAAYLRNNQAKGTVTGNFVNCTIAENTANTSFGGAIDLYGAATKKVVLNMYSCTVVNNLANAEAKPGAIVAETEGATINIWNSIVAGNKTGSTEVNVYKNKEAAVVDLKAVFNGTEYSNASGTVTAVTPVFDVATMVSAYKDGICKLSGSASTNPAFSNGLTATELKALATDHVSADVLAKDQKGNSRSDSEKIMGASVAK